nr:putative ribonuclease h protein [Quercus suber]
MKKLKKDAIYLGAPMFPTRSPSRDFKFLEDKSEAKLAGWRSRCLSWASRATLIKAVAHSIPTYTLSAFNVSANTCNKLDAATRWFWWKPKDRGGKYIAWKSWDKLCHPKKYGGLGFKKTKEMNLALIAKFAWFVASDRQNLCMDVLRSKYKVNSGWLSADPVTAASPTWRAIKEAKKLVAKGGCFLIGEGKPIQVWSNPWVPEIVNFIPQPRLEEYKKFPFKASDLINPISKSWISDWFSNIDPDAMKARQNIQTRFNEIVKVFFSVTQPPKELSSKNWSPPPSDCIKLNVDAATKSSSSTVAVVARNHLGKVLSIWAKKHHSSSPVIAEAESLYWAMNLAVKEGWKSVIFEGDAKNCFDPLINLDLSPEWLTHNIICNIHSLALLLLFLLIFVGSRENATLQLMKLPSWH